MQSFKHIIYNLTNFVLSTGSNYIIEKLVRVMCVYFYANRPKIAQYIKIDRSDQYSNISSTYSVDTASC
jgi:hypothetical protein